ncbi:MAG: serine/threonine-protein kinase [Chryseolinea sp.]
MTNPIKKQQADKELKDYFQSLNLIEWTVTGNLANGGQADIIEVKNNKTGQLGVFRTLRRKKENDIARFYRELEILTKTNHPNIVKILDHTNDKEHQWYISKKGDRFEGHWKTYFEKNIGNPDSLLEEAIRILNGLTDGLIDLHKQGIIHRDIKAKNIVLDRDVPVLIDFGIAFVIGEERLTPVDEAVANMYSPDPSLNFMENVPPWLDVFLLSQLLIWMVSEGTNKPHVQRPLDWRWVVYPKFSDSNTLKVKALTGLCSNYFTAPKDASEFKMLLNKLFGKTTMKTIPKDSDNINKAMEAIQKGISSHLINFSESRSLIESRIPFFVSICKELESGIMNIVNELSTEFKISCNEKKFVDDFVKNFDGHTNNELQSTYQTIFNFTAGESPQLFGFGFSYILYTKKGIENSPQFKGIENIPCIAFTLNGSNDKLNQKGKTKSYYVIPYDNGVLKLQNGHTLELIKEVTIDEIINMTRESITDAEVWETIYT